MTTEQRAAIVRHGERLLAIFPDATQRDPVKLCKALRRLEVQGAALALRLCNGPEFPSEDEADRITERILNGVDALLNFRKCGVELFVNRDPRGYALKMREGDVTKCGIPIERDWGGYGIIAPEFKGV